jgi:hypothetical protein
LEYSCRGFFVPQNPLGSTNAINLTLDEMKAFPYSSGYGGYLFCKEKVIGRVFLCGYTCADAIAKQLIEKIP